MAGTESDHGQEASEGPPPPILELARTLYDNSTFVSRNGADVIYETPGISSAIVTSGLWTCTALEHYDPEVTEFSGQGLGKEFIEQLRLLAQQRVTAKATVISPGYPSRLSPTGYEPDRARQELICRGMFTELW